MIVFNYEKYRESPITKKVEKNFDREFREFKHNQMKKYDGEEVLIDPRYEDIGYVGFPPQVVYPDWCDSIEDIDTWEEEPKKTPFWVLLPVFTGISLTAYCITMTVMSIIDKVVV